MTGCQPGLVALTVSPLAGASCKQPIFSYFFVCCWQACKFSHRQNELAVEAKTYSSEWRKSRHSSPTSGWRCTLELRNVCIMAACVTLSRKLQQLNEHKHWQMALWATQEVPVRPNISTGEARREVLLLAVLKTREIKSRGRNKKRQVQISLHSWFIVTLTHASTLFLWTSIYSCTAGANTFTTSPEKSPSWIKKKTTEWW